MKIYKKLYIDETIENEDEILEMLQNGNIIFDLYLICIEKNSSNLFEILESKEIFNNFNKNKEFILIGMCFGKENAFKIIQNIFNNYITLNKDIKKMKLNFMKNN